MLALPLTALDAINEILSVATESPVSTLEGNEVIDAALAMNILKTTSTEVQTRGWHFNTETMTIAPDQEGFVRLPQNTLKMDTVGGSASTDGIQRGTRLYDLGARSYTFATPVTVEVVLGLDFEELPSAARVYITIRSSRKYQDRYFGNDSAHSYNSQDEAVALAALKEAEIDNAGPNMLSDSTFMQTLRARA